MKGTFTPAPNFKLLLEIETPEEAATITAALLLVPTDAHEYTKYAEKMREDFIVLRNTGKLG